MRAGAPDNVTVVIGDVVESSTAPATQPQVVGSAALRSPVRRVDDSPASRAAALTQQEEDEGVELAEEGRRGVGGRWLRGIGGLVIALLLVGAVVYGCYAWTQQQYFLGVDDDRVAVYQGVPSDLGPITLHSKVRQTDIGLDQLPPFYREEVITTISVDSREAAQERVRSLRSAAEKGTDLRAAG